MRVDATQVWKSAGYRSAADYAAAKTGTSRGAAQDLIDTARKAKDLPNTDEAMRNGDLNANQAKEVADAATADPEAERSLLDSAGTDDFRSFRKKARKAKAAADPDPKERARRLHRERSLRHWTDTDGAFCAHLRTTPEAGARFLAGFEPHRKALFDEARKAGRRESPEAYLADALDAMSTGAGPATSAAPTSPGPATTQPGPTPRPSTDSLFPNPGDGSGGATDGDGDGSIGSVGGGDRARSDMWFEEQGPVEAPPPGQTDDPGGGRTPAPRSRSAPPPATVHFVVDLAAYQRGHLERGETCEIPGVGPINLDTARAALGDAVVKLIIKHGNDIATVIHTGRTVTARQRSALELRDPCCIVPGCGVTHHLEIDHRTGWTITHLTKLDDLARLCRHHHYLKTHCGYWYSGGPGTWKWHPPDEQTDVA